VQPDIKPQLITEILAGIAIYEWIIFTSVNGVKCFFDLFYKAFDDIRCLGPMRIAAVGSATAREIESHHLKVDLIPSKANGDALVDTFIQDEGIESIQMLVVTGNQNRESLVQRLEAEGGAIVDTLPLYKTSKADLSRQPAAERFRKEGADAVLFTSSSTVKSFVDQAAALTLEVDAIKPAYGSIGPLTTKSLKELGLPVGFESKHASLDHFVNATNEYLKS
jgi:uroporphyrinogen-III synthase